MHTKDPPKFVVDKVFRTGAVGESRRCILPFVVSRGLHVADESCDLQCDLKYPDCSNCESANKPCLTYDAGKQAEVRVASMLWDNAVR